MDMDNTAGRMGQFIGGTSKMGSAREKDNFITQKMEVLQEVFGKMASSMAVENICSQRGRNINAFGKTAK